MPPLLLIVLGAAGLAAASSVVARQFRRVNDELDAEKARKASEALPREAHRPLERDPRTGEFRPPG
jgi:hypothetical protein